MLTVKASPKPSQIQGIGLFADAKIPKGTITWKFNPNFDILFDPEEVKKMPQEQQELIKTYAYLSKKSGKYVYSIDNSRFVNHSVNNNIDNVEVPDEPEPIGIANRDIEINEELLINYRVLDKGDQTSEEKYLSS